MTANDCLPCTAILSLLAIALVSLSYPLIAQEPAAPNTAPPARPAKPAWHAPRARHALLLDVAETPDGLVAVGEHGIVLLSEDRLEWRQANAVPVSVALTAVTFSGRLGWAVGHDGVIIASTDGGENWTIQHRDTAWGWPLLDVLFLSPSHGFAIGSYGTAFETEDGGAHWLKRELLPELDWHLNAMLAVDPSHLFIAGEQGYGYRSTDQGKTWEEVNLPYDGSMFGAVVAGNEIIAFGLRGHVFVSRDFGTSWTDADPGPTDSLFGGKRLSDGRVVLVGAKGRILLRPAQGGAFQASVDESGRDLSAVAEQATGELILFGEGGVQSLTVAKGQ